MLFLSKSCAVLLLSLSFSNLLYPQCNSWANFPQGDESAKETHLNYQRLLNAGEDSLAFITWADLFRYVQAPQESPTIHFKDGISFYKKNALKEKNKNLRAVYIDSIINLYNKMAECTGEKSLDRAWMGYNIYALRGNPEDAFKAFEKALDLGGEQTHNMVIVPLTQLSIFMYKNNEPGFDADYLTTLFKKLDKLVKSNSNTSKSKLYQKKWKKAYNLFYNYRDSLPVIWNCDYFQNVLTVEFLNDSLNYSENEKILKILKNKCGQNSHLYRKIEKFQRFLKKNLCGNILIGQLTLYQQAKCKESQASASLNSNDTISSDIAAKESMILYKRALKENDTTMTAKEKAELYYRFAFDAYKNNDFLKARSLCRKASDCLPDWGFPYILVGSMYIASADKCKKGNRSLFESQTYVWVAIDEWKKAAAVDSEVKDEMKKKIEDYKKYLPLYEDSFQHGLEDGDKFMVACWINQSTIVRTRKEN
jgi:hypothetical protein